MPEDMRKKVRHVAWNTRRSTGSLAETLLLIMGTVFWLIQVSPALKYVLAAWSHSAEAPVVSGSSRKQASTYPQSSKMRDTLMSGDGCWRDGFTISNASDCDRPADMSPATWNVTVSGSVGTHESQDEGLSHRHSQQPDVNGCAPDSSNGPLSAVAPVNPDMLTIRPSPLSVRNSSEVARVIVRVLISPGYGIR